MRTRPYGPRAGADRAGHDPPTRTSAPSPISRLEHGHAHTHPITPVRPARASAYYLARPANWRRTALHRQARHLILALTRRVRRLHLLRLADYKLEPMPRLRWYS